MSKRELINAIIQHNRTAAPEFLARFAENELKAYLDRVSVVVAARKMLPVFDCQPGKALLLA